MLDLASRNRLYSAGAAVTAVLSPEFMGISSETSTAVAVGVGVYTGLKAINAGQLT